MSNRRSWRRPKQQRVFETARKSVQATRSKAAIRDQLPAQREAKVAAAAAWSHQTLWESNRKYRKAEARQQPRWRPWRKPNWKRLVRKLREWQRKVLGLKGVTIPPSEKFPGGYTIR